MSSGTGTDDRAANDRRDPRASSQSEKAPSAATGFVRAAAVVVAPPLVLLAVFIALWVVVTEKQWLAPYILPKPADVLSALIDYRELLLENAWITTYETLVGFGLAIVLGLGLGVAIVMNRWIDRAFYPLLALLQVVPKIALAPIFVVWFGFGPTPKVMMAVLISFFPIVISAIAGLRSIDPEYLDMAATMGASKFKQFVKIRFPNSLPHLLSGLKVAVTLAIVGAVVGEFVGGSGGLGQVLLTASGNLDGPMIFATIFVMSAIGVALFGLMEMAERLLIPWHASRRNDRPVTTG